MLGYTNNGYRLWSHEEDWILHGQDVIFDETKFEHKQPFVETNVPEETESDHNEKTEQEFISAVEDNSQKLIHVEEAVSKEKEEATL